MRGMEPEEVAGGEVEEAGETDVGGLVGEIGWIKTMVKCMLSRVINDVHDFSRPSHVNNATYSYHASRKLSI